MGHLAIFTMIKILKHDYNHGLKISKSITFAQITFKNFTKKIKSKIHARFEPVTHRLLAFPSTD